MSMTLASAVGSLTPAITVTPNGTEVHVSPIVTQEWDFIGVEVMGYLGEDFIFGRKFLEAKEVETFMMAQGLLSAPGAAIWLDEGELLDEHFAEAA